MLPDEEGGRREIQTRLATQIGEMGRILTLAMSLVPASGLKVAKTKDVDRLVVTVVLGLSAKAIKTFRAIQLVCEGGLGQDGLALLRVLFETSIALLFLLQRNSRLRARMYTVHPFANRLKSLRTWRRTPGFKRKATKRILKAAERPLLMAVRSMAHTRLWPRRHSYGSTLEAAFEELHRAREAQNRNAIKVAEVGAMELLYKATKDYSSGMPLEQTAKAVKFGGAYQTLYRYASPFAHAGDFRHHIGPAANGGIQLKLIPAADDTTVDTMETASFILWAVARRIDERFGLGRASALEGGMPAMALRRRNRRSADAR